MIRKFLSILAIGTLSCSYNQAKAQICTPDANLKEPGFLPAVLPDAKKDVAYSEAITVLAFKDTSVKQGSLVVKVYIDSMKITNIMGLPNGMSYTCLSPTCAFTPTALSCVKLSGTPTQEGVFPLRIAILAYAKVSGVLPTTQKDTIESFFINVSGTGTVEQLDARKILVKPNPATSQVFIGSVVEPTIFNALGQKQTLQIRKESVGFSLNVDALTPGIYTVKCGSNSAKLVVE